MNHVNWQIHDRRPSRRGAGAMTVLAGSVLALGLLAGEARANTFLHYSFDGHFLDDSGNGNHGTLFDEGDTAFVASPAAFGTAWNDPQQNDPNDRVAFTTPFNPGGAQAWTFAFWHDMEGGVSMPLFSDLDGNNRFRVRADSQNRAELRIAGQATIVWDTNLTLAQNGLFHYAIVADPAGIDGVDVDGVPGEDHVALYVNGALITPDVGQNLTTYATNVYANNLGDGSNTDAGPSLPFETGHGVTDELWIFDQALTSVQVSDLRARNTIVPPDADGDGVRDESDNCPSIANADQANADGDALGDACDACPLDAANDGDGDGICGNIDNCPAAANSSQDDNDGDGDGDACDADDDNDGVADGGDNCPLAANPGQADWDGDGQGDACDLDDDNDGVNDAGDACKATAPGAVVNAAGCSIADLCPCMSPWKNHGAYVSCVARTSGEFLEAGLITEEQKDATTSAAAGSTCGAKK